MRRFALAIFALTACLAGAQERVSNVTYLKQGDVSFTFDVFKPAKPSGKAVIWLVSGGWVSNRGQINADLAKPFNDAGFTVFEVVHGAQPKYQIPEIIKELQHAVRFIRTNASTYGIDPGAIGVSGASSGGHLSLMLGGLGDDGNPSASDPVDRASDRVQAVVAFMPPTDFLNWGADGAVPWKIPIMGIFMPAFGVTSSTPEETLRKIGHDLSPINTINPSFPPTLIVQGDKDPLVPPQQAQRMDTALGAAMIEHQLLIIPGGAHDGKTLLGGVQATLAWFGSHLKTAG